MFYHLEINLRIWYLCQHASKQINVSVMCYLLVYNKNEAMHIHIVTLFRISNCRNVRENRDSHYIWYEPEWKKLVESYKKRYKRKYL